MCYDIITSIQIILKELYLCRKIINYLINFKYFQFLEKITKTQHYIYTVSAFILVILGVNFFGYLYHLEGLGKLFVFLLLIIFFILGIMNGIKVIIDNLGDFQNKFMVRYYCLQFILIITILIFLIYKFFNLALMLILN